VDPNETLRTIRTNTKILITGENDGYGLQNSELLTVAEELAEACDALDGWLSKGGFLPTDWSR
jgi:hypothetical protein